MHLQYRSLFWSFFKIGAFTFGGGYAMLPLIEREIVDRKRWIHKEEFLSLLALSQSLPGPLALNLSIAVGKALKGKKGSVTAATALALPSFVVILIIAILFKEFSHSPEVERIFKGLRPAVVGLIAAPLYQLGRSAGITLKTIWIPALVAVIVGFLGISPIYIILAAIIIGILMVKK